MNSLKNRLAMSAVISALAVAAAAAHAADMVVAQSAGAELRQSENFEQQPSMGSVSTFAPSEYAGSIVVSAPAQAEPPRSGIFHRLAESRPVQSFESALHAGPKRPAVNASPFDDPINTASPGG